ncbi:MAG: glutamate mutase L [Hyphomicrobiales bacterium]
MRHDVEQVGLLIDVGSTWTKGVAVSLRDGTLLARRQHPTTLAQGIMVGVHPVIDELSGSAHGDVVFRAASSSAAGGLRVAAIGLVPDLTGIAARQASLGAGARVVFTGNYILAPEEIDAMLLTEPDILLLCGGTDGGNAEVILENSRRLARARPAAAVVLAGNKTARAEAKNILEGSGLEVRVAENVLPAIDTLAVESAQAAIRDLFLERIVIARSIEELRAWAGDGLKPTPRAVLEATEFLADGPLRLGSLVVVDIGGATTDVHSVGGTEPQPGVLIRGLPEPRIKRTVEGDLGLRVSAAAAADALGAEALALRIGTSAQEVRLEADRRVEDTAVLQDEDSFDRILAAAAIAEALSRHAGRIEAIPLRKNQWFQVGKDLRRTRTLIGSGGVFAARSDAGDILASALRDAATSGRLVPEAPTCLIDRLYVLYAVGLLADRHPQAAAALARSSLNLRP